MTSRQRAYLPKKIESPAPGAPVWDWPSPEAQILAKVREFVEYPGNWSTLDGRRRMLLALLDGHEVEWER